MERNEMLIIAGPVALFIGTGLFLLVIASTISFGHLIAVTTTIALALWAGLYLKSTPAHWRDPIKTAYLVSATFSVTGILVGSYYYPARLDADIFGFILPIFLLSISILSTVFRHAGARAGVHAVQHIRDWFDSRSARITATVALIGISIVALWGFYYISSQYIGNDEGSYVYESLLASQGHVPFRDFISRAPAEIYAFATILSFAPSTFETLKIFNLVLVFCTGLISYLFLRRRRGGLAAFFGSIIIVLNPVFFITKFTLSTTSLSVPLMICALYFIDRETRTSDRVAGAMLALIVFTREIHALFIVAFLIYLFIKKERTRIISICSGGIALAAPVFIFFGTVIGYSAAFGILLGIRHVGVEESSLPLRHTIAMIEFSIVSCAPYILLFAFFKKKKVPWKEAVPALIWIGILILFYSIYSFKRGFLLVYGSEIIPLVALVVFTFTSFDHMIFRARSILVISLIALALTVIPYSSVSLGYGGTYGYVQQYDMDQLIGSGIPKYRFDSANHAIELYFSSHATSTERTILSGNLLFPSENHLRQFMNITRPMAYENGSKVFSMYDAAPLPVIARAFEADPPTIVVADKHLQAALLGSISDTISSAYDAIYDDEYVTIYALKIPQEKLPQKER